MKKAKVRFLNEPNMDIVKAACERYARAVRKVVKNERV